MDPHQGNKDVMPFLFLPLRPYVEFIGMKEHTCNAYIVKSNLESKESESYNQIKICMCVKYMVDIYGG